MKDYPTHYTDEEGGRWQPINQLPGYRSRPDFPAGWLITKIKNDAFPPWNKIKAFKTIRGYRWDAKHGWSKLPEFHKPSDWWGEIEVRPDGTHVTETAPSYFGVSPQHPGLGQEEHSDG